MCHFSGGDDVNVTCTLYIKFLRLTLLLRKFKSNQSWTIDVSQCMFQMLNLVYISQSSDFEIFLININFSSFLFIELCFKINLQITLSKTKQVRRMFPRNSCYVKVDIV